MPRVCRLSSQRSFNGLATLKGLQADHSAEDAMIQFDAYFVDALAKARNGEAAIKKVQAEERRK